MSVNSNTVVLLPLKQQPPVSVSVGVLTWKLLINQNHMVDRARQNYIASDFLSIVNLEGHMGFQVLSYIQVLITVRSN